MTLEPYLSPDAREAALERLAGALGGEVRILGESVEGRAIRAARIPASGGPTAARVLVCAGIHGLELIGTQVALGVLEALASRADLQRLRDRAEVWVLPSLNPDGYARTWEQGGRGELAELRKNARGVDLNRNFPLPGPQRRVAFTFGGWRTGSSSPGNPFYRGAQPLSEPEAAALSALHDRAPFVASANLHSTMGTLIPPHVPDRAEFAAYGSLCRAFRAGQGRWRYPRLSSRRLDIYMGEQEDYQHHLRGTWALCVEHYPLWVDAARHLRRSAPLFWRFNPRDPQPWVDNDVPGIAAFFHAALDRGPPRAKSMLTNGRPPATLRSTGETAGDVQ